MKLEVVRGSKIGLQGYVYRVGAYCCLRPAFSKSFLRSSSSFLSPNKLLFTSVNHLREGDRL